MALAGLSSCGTSAFGILPFVLSELLGPENVKTVLGFQYLFQSFGVLVMMFSTGMNVKQLVFSTENKYQTLCQVKFASSLCGCTKIITSEGSNLCNDDHPLSELAGIPTTPAWLC